MSSGRVPSKAYDKTMKLLLVGDSGMFKFISILFFCYFNFMVFDYFVTFAATAPMFICHHKAYSLSTNIDISILLRTVYLLLL